MTTTVGKAKQLIIEYERNQNLLRSLESELKTFKHSSHFKIAFSDSLCEIHYDKPQPFIEDFVIATLQERIEGYKLQMKNIEQRLTNGIK